MTEVMKNYIHWLRDAHAMEQQAEQMLKAQASRIEHYPELEARITQHIRETQGQRELLETCFERLGEKPSVVKDVMGRLAAFGQAVGGSVASDEVVKGAMAGYVFETLEIATYTTLIAAAEAAGDAETARVCRGILKQEEEMAQWLLEHLPSITTQFLARDADPDAVAKR